MLQKALKESEVAGMPVYLNRERDILRAEIKIKEGDYDRQELLLPEISQNDAQKLLTQILWMQQDWVGLIDIYQSQINLSDEDVIKLTVAYALTGKQDKLAEMQKKYGNRMLQGNYSDSFVFVTNDNVLDYRNLAASLNLDLAKDTVSSYKRRLDFDDLKKTNNDKV